jgi:tRNA(Ile)-lysidine synthase
VAAAVADAGRCFVGFSGGLDSTVLLHAAARAAHGRVTAVHVNHALHTDATAWQEHCRRTAAALDVAFSSHQVRPGGGRGLEARARRARYRAFERCLTEPGDVLLLAHHRGDQAETVLLRLLRGRGLYGMPAARPLGAGILRRPLLELPRQVLADYADRHGLAYLEDPGNADRALDRNFLRHDVLPLLARRFGNVEVALADAATASRAADAVRAAALGPALGADRLPLALLRDADDPVDRLRLWLAARVGRLPTAAALHEFLRQVLAAAADREPRLDLGAETLRRYGDAVYVVAPPPTLETGYAVDVPGTLALPHGVLEVEVEGPATAQSELPAELVVAFRQGGERLRCTGVEKPLKQWFQEKGVPPWARASYPLLYDAHGLLAVPGIARRDPPPGRVAAVRAVWRPFRRGERNPQAAQEAGAVFFL